MSELTNIHARAVKDLTTPTELPVDPNALDQVKLVAGNFPAEYAGNEAITVGMIKDLAAQGREKELEEVHQRITQEETRAIEADSLLTQNKADKTYVDAQDSSLQSQINQKAATTYVNLALAEQTQTVNTALSQLSTLATKFYPTLIAANADIANIQVGQPVQVGEAGANGGLWYKETTAATTLTKSPHDPLTKAKNYADENPRFKSVLLNGTENLDTLPEGRYFISSPAVATALDAQLPPTATVNKIGWIDKVKSGNGLVELKFTRYTKNSNGEYEVFRRLSNGGSSALTWLDWKKDPSRYEVEKLASDILANQIELNKTPRINCFKNVKLTSEEAVTYQATHRVENGIGIASLNNPTTGDSAIFYDYAIDNYIFVPSENISFEIEAITNLVGKIDISVQFYYGSTLLSTTSKANTKVNEFELLRINNLLIPPTTTRIRFRLIRRTGTSIGEFKKPVLVSSAWDAKYISAFQTTNPEVLKNLYYVSKNGSDSNKGNELLPFLTIQKAIDSIIASKKTGRAIINDNGWYRETVTNPSDLHIEIVAIRNKRPSIVGSDQLAVTKTANYTKVYQAPLATKPVGMGGARGKPLIAEWGTPYSVILDEDVHSVQRGDSYRLPFTPMYEAASLAELDTPNGNGKWWWESGVIYFSATDGSDATLKQYEARVRPCFTHSNGTMRLRGIDFLFSSAGGAVFNSAGVVRDDCRVFGSYSNGFSDNANSTMSRFDVAVFNGNDGFNGTVPESSTVGTTNAETTIRAVYFEPYGALNGDDGISFHIHGTCDIWGGLFEYNTKAGVVHVTGGGGNCYSTISRGQTNGFYTATSALGSRNKSSMHCHNTIAEKNTYDYRAADDADLYCVGTYSDNPTGYGYYQTGTGKIVCKNAKYRGDASKMKYGNVVVENFETVT